MSRQSDLQRMTQMATTLDKMINQQNETSQGLLKQYMEQFMGVDNFEDLDQQEALEKAMEAFQHLVGNFQKLSKETKKLESSPTKAEKGSRPGTALCQNLDFRLMKDTMSSIIKIQAWWRQKLAIKMLAQDMKEARETFNMRRQNETPEETAFKELSSQLMKKNLTPEAFFRLCDPDYKMEVEVNAFKNQLNKLGLQLSRGQISRMTMILDESLEGLIKRDEYYDALEAYGVAAEKHKNIDGSPYYPFQNRALFKLIIELQNKDISHLEVFNACDVNDDRRIEINELRKFIEGLSADFNQKEVFTLMNYLDIDKNGIVEKDEFLRCMKKGEQSYKQSLIVAKQTAEKKMQNSASQGFFKSQNKQQMHQNYEVQEDNFFEEDDIGTGDQNMFTDFYSSAKSKVTDAYNKVTETLDINTGTSGKFKNLSVDDQKRAQTIQRMEREGQSFDSFFAQLKQQSTNGKLTLGVVLKGLEVSYPTITSIDRNFLIKDCIVERTKIDYLQLEQLFSKFSKKIKPSVAQAFQVIATNIINRMGGGPEKAIRQFFKAQNVSESEVLSNSEFNNMFSGKFSNLSQNDLDQAFNSLNLDMDGFVHVRDIIEVLISYSSPEQKNIVSSKDLNNVIPGFESMSPRTRSQEVIDYLINELSKKSMAPINVYKMADTNNSGAVQVQLIESTFKKFLPNLNNDIFKEAMNAFGVQDMRDMISRSDFETVFTTQSRQSRPSSSIGKKQQNNQNNDSHQVLQDEATIWIRKLDNAMLREGVSPQVAFKAADINNNNVVTVGELRETFKKLIPDETLSLADLKKVMLAFDVNKNGLVEEHEFIELISQARNVNVTMVDSPLKGRQGNSSDYQQRLNQLPLKDATTSKGKTQQDDQLINTQINQLDKKINIKKIIGECSINEEGFIMINSIGRRLKQESSLMPSEYLVLLKALDKSNSGMIHCKEIFKFCEQFCKSSTTDYTLDLKWIANVIEFQKRVRNTTQYFETNTKMKAGSRLLEVELISELQKNFGIPMSTGKQIFRGISNDNTTNVTLDDFSRLVDQYRLVQVTDTKQVSTSASKLNIDIISSIFWIRICGMLPKSKEQFDKRIGQLGLQFNQIDYKNFYEVMCNEFNLLSNPESKALFEYLRSRGSLRNAIEIDTMQSQMSEFISKLRIAQFSGMGLVANKIGPKLQDSLSKIKMNNEGFISKMDLKSQLQQLGIVSKRNEVQQNQIYSNQIRNELNLPSEFEISAQVQSCEVFDQFFQNQLENCQFWPIISFLYQMTNKSFDELIFKFLGKVFDIGAQNQQSVNLMQQINVSLISSSANFVQIIEKIQNFIFKKNKAFDHGEIDESAQKMLQTLWQNLGARPIKINNNDDDNQFLLRINRHRALLTDNRNTHDVESNMNNKSLQKMDLMKQSINQREPINQNNSIINQLEIQLDMPFEDAIDKFILEEEIPLVQFTKHLREISNKVSTELLKNLCRDVDNQNNGKLIIIKDLISYIKNNSDKYNKENVLAKILQDLDEPIASTLSKHDFNTNDIMMLQDFYQNLTNVANINKFEATALFYDLIEDNQNGSYIIQVNDFLKEVHNAKSSKRQSQTSISKNKQDQINRKIDFNDENDNNEEVEEEKKPQKKSLMKETAVQMSRTKTEIADRQSEKNQQNKELCAKLVDMWQIVYKQENISSAIKTFNNNLFKIGSLNEATKILDPKNEEQITIARMYKQLNQFSNLTEQQKLVLIFLPLNHFQGDRQLTVQARKYTDMIRKITSNSDMIPFAYELKSVYKSIKKDVEDERAGINHISSDEEEELNRDNRVKNELQDILNQINEAMTDTQLQKDLEDLFEQTDEGKVDYYDFGQFLTQNLRIKATNKQINLLCHEIDQKCENMISDKAISIFFDQYNVNFYLNSSKFMNNKDEEDYEGEMYNFGEIRHKIVPKLDFFRQDCSTILRNEEAALVMAEKLFRNISEGEEFSDNDFGAKNNNDINGNKFSLYATGEPPRGYVRPSDVVWLRPRQWNKKTPLFIDKGVASGDVKQGAIGDCWFISALSVIATRDELLRGGSSDYKIEKGMKMTKDRANDLCQGVYPPIFHMYRKKGLYVFRFFKDLEWVYVIIDNKIPCFISNEEPIFGRCLNLWETWVPLIEKAYAKLNGCYESLISGFIDDGLNEMTGLVSEKIKIADPKTGQWNNALGDKYQFWKYLMDRRGEKCMMGCSIVGGTEEKFMINGRPCGIISGHAYAILDVFELKENAKGKQPGKVHRILCIRNPWGNTEWTGKWSDYSEEIKIYKDLLDIQMAKNPDERFEIGEDDGTFLMNYRSFREVFNNMFVCVDFPYEWSAVRLKSQWDISYCAGLPSPSNPTNKLNWATKNPQFYIAPTVDIELFISIAQPDGRQKRDGKYYKFPYSDVINPVQFTICTLSDPNSKRINNFDTKNQVFRSVVKEHREVSARVKLPKGRYSIVCSTRSANELGPFYLSLYFNTNATLVKLTDTQNKNNKFMPIVEEQENNNDVQKWKINLCKQRIEYMISDQDQEIGDIVDESLEKSFLGNSNNNIDIKQTEIIKVSQNTTNNNNKGNTSNISQTSNNNSRANANANNNNRAGQNNAQQNRNSANNRQQNTTANNRNNQPANNRQPAKNNTSQGKKVGFQTFDYE